MGDFQGRQIRNKKIFADGTIAFRCREVNEASSDLRNTDPRAGGFHEFLKIRDGKDAKADDVRRFHPVDTNMLWWSYVSGSEKCFQEDAY